jgi:hypothetical protein
MVVALKVPAEGTQPLHFDTEYARSTYAQFRAVLSKNFTIYWCGALLPFFWPSR